MRPFRLLCAAMTLLSLTSCALSIGPQVRTEYVIARPGQPATVLENRRVKVLPAGASEPVEQDLGGGIWMPREHFEALMRAADRPSGEAPRP